jgi:hypothetical protein
VAGKLVSTIEAEDGWPRKGTVICWVHVAPLVSVPLNPNTQLTGTALGCDPSEAEMVPFAGMLALPNQLGM